MFEPPARREHHELARSGFSVTLFPDLAVMLFSPRQTRHNTLPFREGRRKTTSGAGHIDPSNKKVALLIAVLPAALQLAIVLATANIITGVAFLLWGAMGLGVVGVAFVLIGLCAPSSVHPVWCH